MKQNSFAQSVGSPTQSTRQLYTKHGEIYTIYKTALRKARVGRSTQSTRQLYTKHGEIYTIYKTALHKAWGDLHNLFTAVQGLRFSCYSWAPGHHSWTREPRHTVHVTDVYATESRTPPVLELSADRFSVGLLLHCSPPTQGQSRGIGKGVWRPCTAVLSCERGKTTHLLSIQITTNSSL